MDAIKDHYEKLLFLLALLVLAWSGYTVLSKMKAVERPAKTSAGVEEPVDLPRQALRQNLMALSKRWAMPASDTPSFTSEPRFECDHCHRPTPYQEGIENLSCVFCGEAVNPDVPDRDNDGMPNDYEEKHGLDPNDPADAMTDKDGDFFFNYVEFLEETSPSDEAEHLPYAPFLYMTNLVNQRIRMGLRSKSRISKEKYFFNLILPSGKTQSAARIGNTYEGFKLVSFEEKEEVIEQVDNRGNKLSRKRVDVSELTVEKVKSGRTFVLVLGKGAYINDVSAVIQCVLDPTFKAPIDEWKNKSFSFRGEKFELQKLNPRQAEIKQLDREGEIALVGLYPVQEDPNELDPTIPGEGFPPGFAPGEGGIFAPGVGPSDFPPGYFEPGVAPPGFDPSFVPPAPTRPRRTTQPRRSLAPSTAKELEADMREFNRLKRSGVKP